MDETFETLDDAVEAFMASSPSLIEEPKEPEEDTQETPLEAPEEELYLGEEETEGEGDTDTETDTDDEGESEGSTSEADDEEVAVTVDGAEHKVKVKDLKRLYGQEASLTQKSQAVATQLRTVEAQGLYLASVFDERVKAAQTKYEKYGKVDLFKAYRELDGDEFEALKAAKEAAEVEYNQVTQEAGNFLRNAQETRQKVLRERAKTALVDIQKAIPEWNDELYGKIRGYAISQGLDADTVNEVIEPAAIVMMRKAMLYDEVQAGRKKVAKKVAKAPVKAMGKNTTPVDTASTKIKRIRAEAYETGSLDAVAELLMAQSKN